MSTRWRIAGLLLSVVVAASMVDAVRSHMKRDDARAASLRVALQNESKWKARYSEAWTMVRVQIDTVRIKADGVKVVRDTLLAHLTDTVEVLRYVAATDTALRACTDLANSCERFHATADSLFKAKDATTGWYRAEAAHQARRARLWKYTSLGLSGFIAWRVLK